MKAGALCSEDSRNTGCEVSAEKKVEWRIENLTPVKEKRQATEVDAAPPCKASREEPPLPPPDENPPTTPARPVGASSSIDSSPLKMPDDGLTDEDFRCVMLPCSSWNLFARGWHKSCGHKDCGEEVWMVCQDCGVELCQHHGGLFDTPWYCLS